MAGTERFSLESDGRVAYDASHGFRVRVDLLEAGNGCVDRIYAVEPFLGASVASLPDLLRLRGISLADRGCPGEVEDFIWLLDRLVCQGQVLPELDKGELEEIVRAAALLGGLYRLVLVAVLGQHNETTALRLLELLISLYIIILARTRIPTTHR
jgi:hypothetical protein